ncbi:2-oxo-3-hexenedioate decarboxylase [Hyphomicrobiales bacterium]|nr:2-oxo-3-hexenedioate decarboxylase [Hyphomicrobiales bacterium]CAH1698832.1 2-oxo-3-hexenedioate decarboxylase [Hyphomicrobiales bacterium]CAI0342478.1 2-oxo-3-hexenedioate decarboxylase [Hyphomicrobiales bacterium]
MIDKDALAARLIDEHDRNEQFRPFAAANGIASLDDSYAVQERYVSLLKPRCGAAIGYKIGLTSQRMQTMCGIGHPIAGVVLADRLHHSGARLAIADYGRMGLEFEIAVRMGSDLPVGGPDWTPESIAPHVAGVCAAIEIVDDRAADYAELDVLSLVADNSWNGGVVLSEFCSNWPALDAVSGVATRNGVELGRGHGRDALGHPFAPLAWLANALAAKGETLRAGEIVMTGSLVTTRFPTESETYRFELEGIGAVELDVTAAAA